jgi:CheY-like chemotaxis protein
MKTPKLWTLKGKKILTVDDFPGMRSMMRSMLSAYGADNITEATSGEEAIKHMNNTQYEIILCDYNLGEGKDGQQVLEEAKERNLLPYSSVFIMTTAENTAEMVMGAAEYRPDEYLSKPFTKQVLQARLKKLLDKKSNIRDISSAIHRQDYNLALKLCDKRLSDEPKYRIELLRLKGEIALKMHDYKNAAAIYEDILQGRDIPWATLGLAQALYYLDHLDEARDMLENLIKTNPTYVFADDWLAKVYQKQNESVKSQQILSKAVQKSPKAILRQKALAEISFINEDFDTSEEAYKRVVRIGKHSCYKSPDDYAGLARVYLEKKSDVDVVKTLGAMKKEFRGSDTGIALQASIHEVLLYKDMGRPRDSHHSLVSVMGTFKENPALLSSKQAMVLAEACYELDMKEDGDELVRYVVRNHHDDEEMHKQIQALLSKYDAGDDANKLIAQTCDEVVKLNNQGVELATKGKLHDSISLFVKAASGMPENQTINLNAAQSLIMFMQKNGAFREFMEQAKYYLTRVQSLHSTDEKYYKLLAIYQGLSSSGSKS